MLPLLRNFSFYIAFALLFIPSAAAAVTSQFQDFYPQHGSKYEYVLHHNCSTEFADYLTGRPEDFPLDWIGGGGKASRLTEPVIRCLLENTSEYIKAASASAQVLLGVTPTLLALLGPSMDELALLTVVGRRPFLSLLLSIGSPSVYVNRAFEYHDPAELLRSHPRRYRLSLEPSYRKQWAIVILQYTFAMAAATNIATLNWQLGLRTVCAFWTQTTFAPLVWAILSVPIFIAGTVSLRLRMRRMELDLSSDEIVPIGFIQWFRSLPRRLPDAWKNEWVPVIAQGKIRVILFDERSIEASLSWFLSTCTTLHILFGTLLLSSLLFIGPEDALQVIARYIASVLLCRIILMFEIAGMWMKYEPHDSEEIELINWRNVPDQGK
ncbi:hypothetical protein F5Y15DRAFT_393895 [Xylariaceae sp. FL0016]|nr:hypothetical protein F5Y15DRAFT_393895 [Xylariaceae sp. FL0016]